MEGYLNIDAGTINPYRHGEVFVLSDGTECDLDLGNYERFLGKELSNHNFITAGKIFSMVLEKERQGNYLGRDVLIIPHITGEIKYHWRSKALEGQHDFVIVEIGGTAGDYENLNFIEAAREMRYEEGMDNVIFCHVTPIIYSPHSKELKSKPTQHSVRTLMQLGVQPDFIICRTKESLTTRIKEKVSLYCNIPMEYTIESQDVPSTYLVPSMLNKQKLVQLIEQKLKLQPKEQIQLHGQTFEQYVHTLLGLSKSVNVVIAGKYVSNEDSYLSITHSLEHAGVFNLAQISVKFLEVEDLLHIPIDEHPILKTADAIIVPGGFGKRGLEQKISICKYARENRIPFLGLCLGFQMALIEITRNLCGIETANTTESDPDSLEPVIYLLPTQHNIEHIGGSMRLGAHQVQLHPFDRSQVVELYNNLTPTERFRHRYEFNRVYEEKLKSVGVRFVGTTPDGQINQIFEFDSKIHPYFVGTQFHPEFLSRPLKPHPLFVGLIKAAIKFSEQRKEK